MDRVSSSGAAPLPAGKVPATLLAEILGDLPVAPDDVLLGPRVGEDAAAVAVPAGTLVAAADPITLTGSEVGAFAVTINANDVAVMGARPRWFLATILFPLGTTETDVRQVFAQMLPALDRHDVALIGGHAEITGAVTQTVVAGHMLGTVPGDRLITTGGARKGDVVVQVGPAPVEGATVLAVEAANRLDLPADVIDAAERAADDPGISIVEAALRAAALGATSMHDPTEGGLASGLHEVAHACGLGLRIDRSAVVWFEPGVAVCDALGADPWATLASGCLIATFPPDSTDAAITALSDDGFRVAALGEVVDGTGVTDTDGQALAWPDRDETARVLAG